VGDLCHLNFLTLVGSGKSRTPGELNLAGEPTVKSFYLSSDGQLMAVPISPGTNFDPGVPGLLFRANSRELVATSEQWTYDVTKDGQHFLIDTKAKNLEVQPMTVILNWPSELKEP